MHGTVTLGAEVTNVSTHCFWLLLGDEELAVPFSDFPWFKKATIEQLSDVQRPTEDHLYWPQLDVDLSVMSIRARELSVGLAQRLISITQHASASPACTREPSAAAQAVPRRQTSRQAAGHHLGGAPGCWLLKSGSG
jgi:hypothetical protein